MRFHFFQRASRHSCSQPAFLILAIFACLASAAFGATPPAASAPSTVPATTRPFPARAEELRVLPEVLYTAPLASAKESNITPTTMMHGWLMHLAKPALARYDKEFDRILDKNQVMAYREQKRRQFFSLV